MDGYKEYFCNGQFNNLVLGLNMAQELEGNIDSISLKIDGAPAIVAWSNYPHAPETMPALKKPGVAFKTIFSQVDKGIAEEGKHYFTSEEQIINFMESKRANFPDEDAYIHRTDAFINALKLAEFMRPNLAFQMDVLWSNRNEIEEDESHIFVKPNTISYAISKEKFPTAKTSEFGAVIHSASDSKGAPSKNLIFENEVPSNFCIFVKDDFIPTRKSKKEYKEIDKILHELYDLIRPAEAAYGAEMAELGVDNEKKALKKVIKNSSGIDEFRSNLSALEIFEDSAVDTLTEFFSLAQQANNRIAKNYIVPGIDASDGFADENEGLVVKIPTGSLFKVVSDDFTNANVEHVHQVTATKKAAAMKESKLDELYHINEGIENNGKTLRAWSSSKDPELFSYFFNRQLKYGLGGGSNYGFATYLVIEPPFSTEAKVGYSDDYRKKLYGDSIYEFTIDTSNIFFFEFEDYLKVNPAAKFETYIKEQVEKLLKIEYTPEVQKLLAVESPEATTSGQAMGLFRLLSRAYTQSADGTLRAPIDGFVYRGKNDGKTCVIWNSYALIPERFSNDNGATWKEIDKNSPEFIEYLENTKKGSYSDNETGRQDAIFCGNKTPEKEQAYKILMAYNSNDSDDARGIPDGIFYNIRIKDNKEIDANFRYNLPYTDGNKHYYRVRKNQFIEKLYELGFHIGELTCSGVKVGGDSGKDWTMPEVPYYYWPKTVTGGLKIVNHIADKILPLEEVPTVFKFENEGVVLRTCEISPEVIKAFEYTDVTTETPAKPCYCDSQETYDKLISKGNWNIPEETVVPEKPAPKITRRKKECLKAQQG